MTGPDPWTEPEVTTTERPGAEPPPMPEPEEGE